MSIFSSIGKKIKSVASGAAKLISPAYNFASNIFSKVSPSSQPASALDAYNFTKKTSPSTPQTPITAIQVPSSVGPVGSASYNAFVSKNLPNNSGGIGTGQYGPAQPTSFKSGSKPTSSDYSTQSYSTDYSSFSAPTFQAPSNVTISGDSLGAGTPTVVMPSAPAAVNYLGTALEGNVAVGGDTKTGIIKTAANPNGQPTGEQKQSTAKELFDEYVKSLKAPASEAEAYQKAQEESGLLQAQQQRNNTQNEINAVTSRMNQDLLQLRGTAAKEGVVEAVYGGQQAQVTREATIRLLPLQAQLAADQGNLDVAQERLDNLFKIYSTDARNSVDYYNKNVEALYTFLTDEEKKKADAIVKQRDFEASLLKDEINNQQQDASQALKDGNTALYRALTSLRPPTNVNSPTFAQDKQNYLNDKAEAIRRYGTSNTGGNSDSETVTTYAQLLADGKISLANVPQNIRNQVVAATGGIINKPLSDTAIKDIQQSQSAIANLNALKGVVESNLQYVGPVKGLARFNPYSKARQVQSEIDRVRQQVGKTLEGGVLRKEDEEKYKKILATLADTPETALYKIDSLISSLERDIELYKTLQRDTGRFVPGTSSKPEDLRSKYNY